ncbi:MAG: carboxypeptidase-like regulatory domain-containing protein, partial [Flavitalea sp.]
MQLTAKTARAASFTALTTLVKKPQRRQLLTTSVSSGAFPIKPESQSIRKLIFRVMKLTAIVLLTFTLHLSAAGLGQGITLSVRNTPLEKVFKEIKKQSGYQFLYNNQMLDKASKVTISISGAALEDALEMVLRNQPYDYIVVNKTIILKQKESAQLTKIPLPPIVVKGRVTDEKGEPLVGVSIKVKGTNNGVSTGVNGQYELTLIEEKATLIFSYVGFTQQEIIMNNQTTLNIKLLEEDK